MPRFFIIGTKYGRSRSQDKLPDMVRKGVIATGFAGRVDLRQLVGLEAIKARNALDKLIPGQSSVARSTLAHFLSMQPGDIVALKSHSAPYGTQARLVIARYAVVSGKTKPRYKLLDGLGHSIKVEFLAEQDRLELPYGYGRTLHEITDAERASAIFGHFYRAANEAAANLSKLEDKAVHESIVTARGAYIMGRIHNELQNELRERLITMYGRDTVAQEQGFVDLSVSLPDRFILIEVKGSPSPSFCIREAVGQMLYYAWQLNRPASAIEYVIVGPNDPAPPDNQYLDFVRAQTRQNIRYVTPKTYVA